MQARSTLAIFAVCFVLVPPLFATTIGLVTIFGEDAEFAIVMPAFVPFLLACGGCAIGQFIYLMDAKANTHLSETERTRWYQRMKHQPFACLLYWHQVGRWRGREDRRPAHGPATTSASDPAVPPPE